MVRTSRTRAGLPAVPILHYVPSTLADAFATGFSGNPPSGSSPTASLRSLTPRELAGVAGPRNAHIANEDPRVNGLLIT